MNVLNERPPFPFPERPVLLFLCVLCVLCLSKRSVLVRRDYGGLVRRNRGGDPAIGAPPVGAKSRSRCRGPVECGAYSSGVAPRRKTGTWPADGTGAVKYNHQLTIENHYASRFTANFSPFAMFLALFAFSYLTFSCLLPTAYCLLFPPCSMPLALCPKVTKRILLDEKEIIW